MARGIRNGFHMVKSRPEYSRKVPLEVACQGAGDVELISWFRLKAQIQSCRFPCLIEAAAAALSAEALALNARQNGSLESQAQWGKMAEEAWVRLRNLDQLIRGPKTRGVSAPPTPLTKQA